MSRLFLCEKPAQARDIARVLGARQRGDGCLNGPGVTVTWCVGHLLEMDPPEAYGEELKRWRLETLPILPSRWKLHPRKGAAGQLKTIGRLLKSASEVVVATDADREGETIAREVLDRFGWRGPVLRLWLSALDEASIRKALAGLLPGEKTRPLYLAGLARSRADWMVGMNLTRAYTILGRERGHDTVLSVGRVQTPTLRLVVDRDREIEAFRPRPYWEVVAMLEKAGAPFPARWRPSGAIADEEGRCMREQAAREVATRIQGRTAVVTHAETKRVREAPPLPFDLGTLQQEASRRWGMGAQQVLDIAQSLYETHKATTYPRTDCRYLPESMFGEVDQVLKALVASDPDLEPLVRRADRTLRSRAWNDKKITAHHAIIPTTAPCDVSGMNADERRLYDLIRRHYLAQFYPRHEYDQTEVELAIGKEAFESRGRRIRAAGWRTLLGRDEPDENGEQAVDLPPLEEGDRCAVVDARMERKETRPPRRYTEGTLIAAMKNAARLVEDPQLRKRLRETAGIGTEATRAGIIQTLLDRGFLRKEKKHLVSTETGRALIDALPEPVKDPGTTALWEQALEDIAQGRGDMATFLERQAEWVRALVHRVQEGSAGIEASTSRHPCPECGRPMRRRKGAQGWFWGCSGYPECRCTLPDARGKPGKRKSGKSGKVSAARREKPARSGSAGNACPECGDGSLVQRTVRNGKNAGREFLGCSRYPRCRYFAWT